MMYLCVYNPPIIRDKDFQNQFNETVNNLLIKYDHLYLIGDLNYNLSHATKGKILSDLCEVYGLTNMIVTPTCHTTQGDS